MKAILASLALMLSGCSMITGITFYLDDSLNHAQRAAAHEAAELWTDGGMPVLIVGSRGEAKGVIRVKRGKPCKDSSAWAHQTVIAGPTINLCPGLSGKYYREIIAHEMGHAVSGRDGHPSDGNIMLPSIKGMQGFFLNEADVDYILGARR